MKVFVLFAALAASGCNFLDAITKREPVFDPRIPIEPGMPIPDTPVGHVGELEREKYRCTHGAILVCQSWGVTMDCRCRL